MHSMQHQENLCKFVSSRGILKSCDIYSHHVMSSVRQLLYYDFSNMHEGDTIYVSTSAIPHFKSIMGKITKRFILVSGDSDEECAPTLFSHNNQMTLPRQIAEFNEFINNPLILHWFAQNCIVHDHPKISPIPIGLDYHTIANTPQHPWGGLASPFQQEADLMTIRENAAPFQDRVIDSCYANFHFQMNTKYGYERREAIAKIPKELMYYELQPIPRLETWRRQSKMAFVVSPHGNGLDCHRTWEALILGCIVIVKKSPLDNLYKDLPVLILDDWSQLTADLLKQTVNEFAEKTFQYEKLTLKYWKDLISSTHSLK